MAESKLTLINPSSKEFDEISDLISKSHPEECIISIHKIENDWFDKRFEDCRAMLKNKRGFDPDEIIAYHGCALDSAKNIAVNGFLTNQNKISAYGIGTYFGGFYNISRSYSVSKANYKYKALIVAKILLGKRGVSKNNSNIDLNEMDCSVSNLKAEIPEIISLPIDEASKPLYIVQFYNFKK